MVHVVGLDGCPGGWAAFVQKNSQLTIRRVTSVSTFLELYNFDTVAIDIPIGLLDAYEIGGRACDRAARALLGRARSSSVFPAPVRSVLAATSFRDACEKSRASAPSGRAISKQTFAILPKIREVDDLLQEHPQFRDVIREVHPEVSFCELVGEPMQHRKGSIPGREERRRVLARVFPELSAIEQEARAQGIPTEDVLDAGIACWSGIRLATGKARALPANITLDPTGLPMAIWI